LLDKNTTTLIFTITIPKLFARVETQAKNYLNTPKKLEQACLESMTKFIGEWSPHQDTWRYATIIEANTMNEALRSFREAGGKVKKMPLGMIKCHFRTYPKVIG